MSRVSITGAKRVLDDVIETTHDLNLLHVTDYDGAWEGFEPGDPIAGADAAAERLVTVRSLESILDLDDDPDGSGEHVDTDDLADRLERVRGAVNDCDDRRDDLRDERRELDERASAMAPLETLGIDLDLLSGYDSLETSVGEGDEQAVRDTLDAADDVDRYETFAEDGVVAVFAHPTSGSSDVLEDALVGAEFAAIEVPDAEKSPAAYLDDLDDRRAELDREIESVEAELDDLREKHGDFLLAAEEQLTIEVEKREIPLAFATTKNAFVAEGWLPTEQFVDLAEALEASVGEHCEVEELERAAYDSSGQVADREPTGPTEPGVGDPETAADGGNADSKQSSGLQPLDDENESDDRLEADGGEPSEARRSSPIERSESDGGTEARMADGEPPVVQKNPKGVRPFELLTKAVGRPSYAEFDPTIILFLTFPLMFGFMIGDVGYGLIYTGIGYWVYNGFDSDTYQRFGAVALAAGISTTVFGVLYGEIFGLHLVSTYLWEGVVGLSHAPIEKGLSPATSYWARTWFVVTALFGILHLNLAWIFEFIEEYTFHGFADALKETGSWLLALNGLWLFIFSRLFDGSKPDLLFEVFSSGDVAAFELGFTGFPAWVGIVGGVAFFAGLGLLAVGPTHELVEAHQVLAHVLSYLRIAAVLLAKAGMAFAVNLLVLGVYVTEGEYHFIYDPGHIPEEAELLGALGTGLIHGGPVSILLAVVVLLVGHLVVLLLGVTSAGIQSIRLEYFEFFSKFYEGSGAAYDPFGYARRFTTDE
ncbi:V-type ATP synthase subunit I [Halococcus salifodinae]|uniref:A-type ATP synthase subunit I n=2 Tax=Halococcaceae TaxID=1963270 RepID=M0NCE5_9EURY|nr:V-type ATP synthase subunit I [Halococcus salifodinae]EMA55248.1 archaeal/vacuolar-type h+-ATPase subunit i [Halococcus salifodinae DSM 8989]